MLQDFPMYAYIPAQDLARARRLPSPQLVGTPAHTTLDLNVLAGTGVEIVGRLATVRDGRALFSGGLRNQFALADLKMDRLLETFDEWARGHVRDADVGPPERFAPTRVPASPRLWLDFNSGEIRSQRVFLPPAPASAEAYETVIRERYRDLAPAFLRLYPSSNIGESMLATLRDAIYGWATERMVRHQAAAGQQSVDPRHAA